MIRSFNEFKFFQSFRVPVEQGDGIRFSVSVLTEQGKVRYLDKTLLLDISPTGLGFNSSEKLQPGDFVDCSFHFRKWRFDVSGKVVRVFGRGDGEKDLFYGVELDKDDHVSMRRFVEQYIMSMTNDKMRTTLSSLSLGREYDGKDEGFEMVSMFFSIFEDMKRFGEREGFIDGLLEEFARRFKAQRASVFLINTETNELEAAVALDEEKEKLKFDYRKGIAGSVFTTGLTLNVDTADKSSKFYRHIDIKTGFKTKSILCTPVRNKEGKIIGVFQVLNKMTEDRFSLDDERLMRVASSIFSSIYYDYNPMSERSLIRRFSKPYDREFALVGNSVFMRDLRKAIVQLKDLETPILIEGERGTGKKLLARVLHNEGKRGLGDFGQVNCSSYKNKEEELENLLFGSEGYIGKFNEYMGGTLVLEEVTHISRSLQGRIVEMLMRDKMGSRDRESVRIIATTSEDFDDLIQEKKMHKGFFRLLERARIKMIPLRDRRDDIPALIQFFTEKECKKRGVLEKQYSERVINRLSGLDWSGNVVELKAAVEKLVLYHNKENFITNINNMALPITRTQKGVSGSLSNIQLATDSEVPLRERIALIEREIILDEIRRAEGNKSQAARNMSISREALRKKLILGREIMARHSLIDPEDLRLNKKAA